MRSNIESALTTRGTRPRIAVFGEWNTTNLGDRAIFEGVYSFFNKMGWDVDGYGLGSLTPVKHFPYLEVPTTRYDSILQTANIPSIPKTFRQPIRSIRQQWRAQQLIPRLQQAQVILVGGGALLSDQNLHFPQSLTALTQTAQQLQIPMMCLGCGLEGKWSLTGRHMIKRFLESCWLVAVRDQHTALCMTELLSYTVELFGDFALASTQQPIVKPPAANQYTIAVNVMELPKHLKTHQYHYEDYLVETLQSWCDHRSDTASIVIQVFTTGTLEDSIAAQRVFMRLERYNPRLCLPASLEQLKNLLHSSQVVVASRLHAAILAISEGTPVIGFSPGSKIQNFLSSIGVGQFNINLAQGDVVKDFLNLTMHSDLSNQMKLVNTMEMEMVRSKIRKMLEQIAESFIRYTPES